MSHQSAGRRIDPRVSSGCAAVIIEEPAESLSTANPIDAIDRRCAVNEFVAEPLVIPLSVVMLDEFGNRPSEMTFTARDHPVEALVLDRAHEPFGIGIRIRRPRRRLHHAEPGLAQPVAQRGTRSVSLLDRGASRP
jgi:hypothetical protein